MKSPSSSARSAAVPASHKPASPVTFLSVCFIPLQVPDVSGSYPFNTWRESDLHTAAHLRIPGVRTLSAMAIVAAFLLSTPARAACGSSEVVVFEGQSVRLRERLRATRRRRHPPDYAGSLPDPRRPVALVGGHHFQDGAPGSSNWPARWGLRQRRAGVSTRGGCA